jgi:hypothetical protein
MAFPSRRCSDPRALSRAHSRKQAASMESRLLKLPFGRARLRFLELFCLRVHSTPRWSSHRDSGDIDLIFPKTLEPSYDRFAEFGNDTGVQQIVNHLNSVPLRRFSAPRFGASF